MMTGIVLIDNEVVDENPSCLGDDDEVRIPTDATHSQMCKFGSASDPLFSPILEQIKRCSENIERDVLHKDVPGNKQSQNGIYYHLSARF